MTYSKNIYYLRQMIDYSKVINKQGYMWKNSYIVVIVIHNILYFCYLLVKYFIKTYKNVEDSGG